MIKAIIFDVGGVLIRTEDPGPRRALEVQYGLEPGQAEYMAFNSPLGLSLIHISEPTRPY